MLSVERECTRMLSVESGCERVLHALLINQAAHDYERSRAYHQLTRGSVGRRAIAGVTYMTNTISLRPIVDGGQLYGYDIVETHDDAREYYVAHVSVTPSYRIHITVRGHTQHALERCANHKRYSPGVRWQALHECKRVAVELLETLEIERLLLTGVRDFT